MKKLVIMLGLISFSVASFAHKINCQNLGITITNESGHDCKLKTNSWVLGYLYQGTIPSIIPNGTRSETFYMQQGWNGIELFLDYRCDGKLVMFSSIQEYCGYSAGHLQADHYLGNDLNLIPQVSVGSYWSGTPGQISWKIY